MWQLAVRNAICTHILPSRRVSRAVDFWMCGLNAAINFFLVFIRFKAHTGANRLVVDLPIIYLRPIQGGGYFILDAIVPFVIGTNSPLSPFGGIEVCPVDIKSGVYITVIMPEL